MTPDGTLIFAPLANWKRVGAFAAGEAVSEMLGGNHPSWNTILFRHEVIQKLGYFDDTLGLVMDLEFSLRVAARLPIFVSRIPCGIFVRHTLSAGEHADAKICRDYESAAVSLGRFLPDSAETLVLLQQGLREMLGQRLLESGIRALSRARTDEARECLLQYEARFEPSILSTVLRILSLFPSSVVRFLPVNPAISFRGLLRGHRCATKLEKNGFAVSEATRYLATASNGI